MMPRSRSSQLAATGALIVITIALFQVTDLDLLLQDLFYDSRSHRWLIDRSEPVAAWIFYDGIKAVLTLFAVALLGALTLFRRSAAVRRSRKGLLTLLLALIAVPALVGTLKSLTNTPCPRQIEHYGGPYPEVKVLDTFPEGTRPECRLRCWPAGHASGGFAMMALFFLFRRRAWRVGGLVTGMLLGWSKGIYKMAIGDHFFSHTLMTMLIAWEVILLIRWAQECFEKDFGKAAEAA